MILCDTLRTPFDLGEAESELVRGINTEHLSVTFVLLFLREYASILFFRFLTSFVFFGGRRLSAALVYFFVLVCRRTFVRVKMDQLMSLI